MGQAKWMFWAIILTLGFHYKILAQDSIVPQAKSKKASSVKISKAASDLKESLDSNDELKIARNYEVLAKGFIDKEDFARAEEYLKKALW
jgi:hypothetical protein